MQIPLSSLQTFVLVARFGRMRDAAAKMALTPGAISQRIRDLEDRIGHRLFTRTRTGVALNAAGQSLFDRLNESFRKIEAVCESLDAPSSRRVRITTVGSFAANWLVARLSSFSREHPDIDVEVEAESRTVDLRREPVDLAIRHGLGGYSGLISVRLMAPEMIVVASPMLLSGGPQLRDPGDCLAFPLLHDMDRADWRLWFEALGVKSPTKLKGPSFSDEHLIVRAAVSGQGLALVSNLYADDELRTGRLVQPIKVTWPASFAYYVVSTAQAQQRAVVMRFWEWLIREAGRK